ncbi:MAG: SDR family oxidoreductase [Bacteroidetes bacterium]|nr:SDR family oxidoreductase [Bacteroidota bacterium]
MNIVITGASRGIGRATAELFAANGHHLYLSSRNETALYKAMEELMLKFPDVTIKARPYDLSKKENAIAMGDWIVSLDIPVDVVFNNAGSFLPGNVYNEKEGILESQLETNLYSAYHLTRTILPKLMKQKSGHIFNMCSVASLQAYRNGGSYSISKFALLGFSRNLREELKPHGIKVTTVIAGAAYTDSWSSSGIDRNRFMEASDIAKMIYASSQLSPQACVEEIVMRPQLGDV